MKTITTEELASKVEKVYYKFSYDLAMRSEDGKFFMTDIMKAFHLGVDAVLYEFGVIDGINGEYTKDTFEIQ